MNRFYFASSIDFKFKKDLEQIFFFNPSQHRYHDRIVAAIEAFSKPILVVEGDKVMLAFEEQAVGQGLHIFEIKDHRPLLVGGLLYTRDCMDRLTIAHIALGGFRRKDFRLLTEVNEEMKRIAKRVRGVQTIYFHYSGRSLKV